MHVLVHCCGLTGRLIGAGTLRLELPAQATVRDLFALLSQRSTELAQALARCACARGDSIVPRGTALADGDELALLPPVAGG
jgi:molybdopterin converting factor small subunit